MMPRTAIGIPAGASSKKPIGAIPLLAIISLITMLVDVLMSETEEVRMVAKASGSSSSEGLVPLRGHAQHDRHEERRRRRVADEGRECGRRDHHHGDQQQRMTAGAGEDPLADRVDDAGPGQRGRHDEEAEDHQHRSAAESAEGLFGRDEARADDRQHHAERHHVGRNAIPREEDDRRAQNGEAEHDLHCH